MKSGGKNVFEGIDSSKSLEYVVSITSSWFSNRKVLFICDDLWKHSSRIRANDTASSSQTSYFNQLQGLLDGNPESHMVISTRDGAIATEAGTTVLFESRSYDEARAIFMKSAKWDEKVMRECASEDLVKQVLERCGGIPLLLSLAGAQVRKRSKKISGNNPRGITASLKNLLHSLNAEQYYLQREQPSHYSYSFNGIMQGSLATVAQSLESSVEFMQLWNQHSRNEPAEPARVLHDFITDSFRRLCVLPGSARISNEVIFAIWCIASNTFGGQIIDSLVDFHVLLEYVDEDGKSTYGLHDEVLEYCGKVSRAGQHPKYKLYHGEFLSYSFELFNRSTISADAFGMRDECSRDVDAFWVPEECVICRPWWKILLSPKPYSEIGSYLVGNLFRHLRESNRLAEAVGLLSHMGWTKLRTVHGGLNALNADFSIVTSAIEEHPGKSQHCKECDDALRGIMTIWQMLGRAWPVIWKHPEGLATHAYGHLMENEKRLPLVDRYLGTAADVLSGPWLKPKSAFWRILDSASGGRAFRTVEDVVGVAMGSNNVIAATTSMVLWIDTDSMTAKREMGIGSDSRISAFCWCESQRIVVLGFSSGEIELRNEQSGERIGDPLRGHEKGVTSVGISRDGRTVVSGSWDSTVRLWDVQSGSQIGDALGGHEDGVTSVGISEDGRTVVSGSYDNTVRLWDVQSGSQIGHPLRGHENGVTSVGISGDGRTVVSGSYDNTVRLWDVQSRSQIGHPLRGHEKWVTSVGISGDGRTVVSGSDDNTVRLWDVQSGSQIGDPLRDDDDIVLSVGISGDGRTVVSGSYDNTVRLWDVQSGSHTGVPLRGHEHAVRSVRISRDGRTVVSGSWDKTVRLWDVQSGSQIGDPLRGHEAVVTSVGISGDGRTVVSGSVDQKVRLWDVQSGSQIGDPLRGHEYGVTSVGISEDGRTVVSGSYDNTVRLWDVQSGSHIGVPLRGHEHAVRSVRISRDGRTVVSGSWDKTVRLWDVQSGSQIGDPLRGHEAVVLSVGISGDGRTVVSGSVDQKVRLWDVQSGSQIGHPLRGHEHYVMSVGISGDGKTVLSRSGDGTVFMWSASACGIDWYRSYVCSLPVGGSTMAAMAFVDGDASSGVVGTLCIPMSGLMVFLDLVRP